MDCSPPGPSVHGIFQARVLEWGAIAFSGIFPDQGSNPRPLHWQPDSHSLYHQGSPRQLIFNKCVKAIQWRKGSLWNEWWGHNWTPTCETQNQTKTPIQSLQFNKYKTKNTIHKRKNKLIDEVSPKLKASTLWKTLLRENEKISHRQSENIFTSRI